jgi:hypothetical protein
MPKTEPEYRNGPHTDAVVQLTGEDGNAYAIIARVRSAIQQSNSPELEEPFLHHAMASDYNTLLQVCMRFVTVK